MTADALQLDRTLQQVEAAGCSVRSVETLDTEHGPYPVLVVVCPNAASMTALLEARSVDDASDPTVRDLALQLAAPYAALRGDERSRAVAGAIQLWTQQHVAFVPEQRELFQRARYTMRRRAGDCDDHAALTRALGVAAGVPARLQYYGNPRSPRHVVTAYRHHGAWEPAETTVQAAYGEDPFAAARRLNVRRTDLGVRRTW